MKIPARFAALLLDFAQTQGLNRLDLQQHISQPVDDWCAADSWVLVEDYIVLVETIYKQLEDELLGLRFGNYLNLSALGIIHQISLQTNSIEQALLLLQHYFEHQFPILNIQQTQQEEALIIQLTCPLDSPVNSFVLDASCCLIYRELSLMLGNEHFQLLLPHRKVLSYEIHFRRPVETASCYGFKLPLKQVNQNINRSNLKAIELLLPQYLQLLEAPNQSFASAVRHMLLRLCAPEVPNLQMVAQQFAMSSRSFQRKLAQEGQSFRAISNNIKQNLARYLSAGNKMKTQDIAYILGYSEASAYINALKKWNINP